MLALDTPQHVAHLEQSVRPVMETVIVVLTVMRLMTAAPMFPVLEVGDKSLNLASMLEI